MIISFAGISVRLEYDLKINHPIILSRYLTDKYDDNLYKLLINTSRNLDACIGRDSIEPRVDQDDDEYLRSEYYDERGELCAYNEIDRSKQIIKLEVLESEHFKDLDYIIPFLAFEKLLWLNKRFILHSSVVEVDGKSIAFVGKSGIGKSTQAGLWQKYENARLICGDRSAVYISDSDVSVYGIPFDGTARVFSNIKSSLAGIVCLRQGNEEKLERLGVKDAFSEIYPQITVNPWNKEFQKDAIDFVFNLISRVPVYRLTCRISKEAVDLVRGEVYGK